jgi:hypothetical protein
MKKNVIIGICSLFLGIFLVSIYIKSCIPTPVVVSPENAISVKPTPISHNVENQLPNGQTAHTQIDIPHVTPGLGTTPTQHVVVTDQGNTLVVTTSSIDFGFGMAPKLVFGFDNMAYGGAGIGFFKVYRFSTDAMLTVSGKNLNTDVKIGIGESYQLLQNTYVGVSYQVDASMNRHLGAYISLNF